MPVLLQQARLTSKCHRWQAVRPAQRRVRLSEAAPIGPIIGHSDRAASEQKAFEPSHPLISTLGFY